MDSETLKRYGIVFWMSFDRSCEKELLETLPEMPGVYVVLLKQPETRRFGSSDIAYVGSAKNQRGLRGRVAQYFHPGWAQKTNIDMHQRLVEAKLSLRIGFVSLDSPTEAKRLESDLLIEFESEHGELPPYNRQRALDLVSRSVAGTT